MSNYEASKSNRYGFHAPTASKTAGVSDEFVEASVITPLESLLDKANKAASFKPGTENQLAIAILTQCVQTIDSVLLGSKTPNDTLEVEQEQSHVFKP